MSDNNDKNTFAALGGALTSAAISWIRLQNDTDNQLRTTRGDIHSALQNIQNYITRGEQIRLRLPVVSDFDVGLAMATKQPQQSQTIPQPPAQSLRPAWTEEVCSVKHWPPDTGIYDDRGNVSQLGEMTTVGLAMTMPETRTVVEAFAQQSPPTQAQLVQAFRCFNSLMGSALAQQLTPAQWRSAWDALLALPAANRQPSPHRSPQSPPSVISVGPGVDGIVPLSSTTLPGHPFRNVNTDAVSWWRIRTAGADVSVGAVLGTFRFGSEYRVSEGGTFYPLQPAVVAGPGKSVAADGVTSMGFVLVCQAGIAANTSVDVCLMAQSSVEQ